MSDKISVQEYREMQRIVISNKPAKSKMSNVKTILDGVKYDSKKEATRAGQLKLMVKAGVISALQEQVAFHFADTTYVADFVYFDREKMAFVVEDAKGHRTATYIHKRKLMLKYYNIKILET